MKNYVDGGEAIVEAFRKLDIDYVMASPGSEWGAVWEAFARQDVEKNHGPVYLSCAHETLAVNLAIGYTVMTGRMQAVMLHTGVGLLQGAMGIDAANRQGVPMLVVSGESLTYSEQPDFEPGPQWLGVLSVVGGPHSLVQNIVKWSQSVSSPYTLHEQLVRAGEMAQRSPAGPVYMSVPIETMLHEWTPPQHRRIVPPAPKPVPAAADIERVADLLAASEAPLVIAESIGRDPEGYDALVELADLLAIPVFESGWLDFNNFPKDHPLYQGIGAREHIHDADLVLTLRSRSPWMPPGNRPAEATVVNIDETPFRPHMVHQNLQADIFLEGDAVAALKSLAAAVRARAPDAARVKARLAKWSAVHDALVAGRRERVDAALAKTTISPLALCSVMGGEMPDDAIYVDETITHRRQIIEYLDYRGPLSFFSLASGGLGQGLGLALGVKLAKPDRPVVSVIGDGSFSYNPVTQSLALSKHRDLPIMIVIFNNSGYSAMRKEHQAYYPDGVAAAKNIFYGHTVTDFDYAEIARPFGFYGRTVDALADLPDAFREALAALRGGRTAILNVMVDDGAPATR
ncbi:MAG: thiamine pyrophosphate-dependent enzyme [Rhodospirillaceae bacterium]